MSIIHHALILNLHQPAGNLEYLLERNPWEAKEILYTLDRIPRALWSYEDVARVHLALSGTLLETLANPDFQQRVYGIVKCGDLLWYLQNTALFEILGNAYYHPALPLIPDSDREEHIRRWLGIGQFLFNRTQFIGFWPPEMAFTMELIPLLKKHGFRYVLVDSLHVEPLEEMSWQDLRYRPHIAEYGGEEIIVVVRDRELSDAQEAGMEFDWFLNELYHRTQGCDFPPLVTTCSDGDNGGWFRNTSKEGNFWGIFYQELLTKARRENAFLRPIFIHDYLDKYGAKGRVKVKTAAWNTGDHSGINFVQWTGSEFQKEALKRVAETSATLHGLKQKQADAQAQDPEIAQLLNEAEWHLLRSETSCHFYWGEAWTHRAHQDLDAAWTQLNTVMGKFQAK
ncbi:glycoside hydrolase family 57 [Nitrosococcus wardiae]|uniref:Glycoside hydrolase family 57 n=1 Tax=Nitrosococcus wardiae TaxID=1814290 RepID=A0A4P7BZX4_9GAMM|nr:glycoside hydrolase family 57 [Nitrosococcus wardiae]QBQ54790.1 glycoside hydrolase family 57 [Nitrosococcus wardiae]